MRHFAQPDPEKAIPKPRDSLATLRSLLPYLWPKGEPALKTRVVGASLSLLISKLANLGVPLVFRQAINDLGGKGGVAIMVPVGLILAYGMARVMTLLFTELRDAIFAKVGQTAIRRVALNVFTHLHRLSLRFHLERQTGGLSRSIERGTRGIESLLFYLLFNILPTLLEIGLVTAILWRLFDWRFAVAIVITVACYLTYTILITEWRGKFRRKMHRFDSQAHSRAIDSLLNYETVKYFGNEAHEAGLYDEALAAHAKAAVKDKVSLSILNVGQAALISTGLTVIMWMAAGGIAAGRMSIGDFVLVNTYLLQLYQPLNFFGVVYREIKQSLVDMEKMFELTAEPSEVSDQVDAAALRVEGGEVAFRDVRFGYDPRREILSGVSFTIPAGKTVAVIGATGAGKSTISRLLFRFYDVTGGAILIDGQDIREVTQASLRAAIGIVPQDTVLFNDTIRYNIAYGKPGASQEEIEQAAKLARIHPFILAMPDRYDTKVGERGLKLSGGEKQRVAIARTLLKNPAIFVFDEATSALDTHTEREIQANLREVSRGRTTLTIAHRLSTIVEADEILVLDGGRIVERGRHEALLAADGAYAAMWRKQQKAITNSAEIIYDRANEDNLRSVKKAELWQE